MDRLTPQQRSLNMSRVKSKNTTPELLVFTSLKKLKISFSKHYNAPGKPDIAFRRKKVAVFINGEFWHGRNYKNEFAKYPEFWIKKIKTNMIRDRKNYRLLKIEGWKIVKLWDKDIKRNPVKELNKIFKAIDKPLVNESDL